MVKNWWFEGRCERVEWNAVSRDYAVMRHDEVMIMKVPNIGCLSRVIAALSIISYVGMIHSCYLSW